jgi:hypothetical protein
MRLVAFFSMFVLMVVFGHCYTKQHPVVSNKPVIQHIRPVATKATRHVTDWYSEHYGEFAPYVKSFVSTGRNRGYEPDVSKVTIQFVDDLPNNWIGVCHSDTHSIYIVTWAWDRDDTVAREQLIWHELGHCVLGRDHKNDTRNGHAVSIMNSNSTAVVYDNEYYYITHHDEYVRELFP